MMEQKKASRREKIVATLLVLSIALISIWEIAAKYAQRPFDELKINASDFQGFRPESQVWKFRLVHTNATPTEPTAIAYEVRTRATHVSGALRQEGFPVLTRIVHGYNMVDCMRIKGYKVELLVDTRQSPAKYDKSFDTKTLKAQAGDLPVQIWRLTSSAGKVSIWLTTMLEASDFAATAVDTRDMAFPRIGSPDDPAYKPTGLKWSSFKHPIRNSRNAIRARWNASRCDLLTFLRLRRAAWASDVMLTFVSEYHGPSLSPQDELTAILYTLKAHQFMLTQFQNFWRKSHTSLSNGSSLPTTP